MTHIGAVHKVRHARGEGFRGVSVTVCDRGEGVNIVCDATPIKFVIIHMKHEIKSDVYLSAVTDVF